MTGQISVSTVVALRKESVDRNIELSPWGGWGAWSLSARRAWIEIIFPPPQVKPVRSLSARRAWIEISSFLDIDYYITVALRKESVDRNPFPYLLWQFWPVALRKESVDRNSRTIQVCRAMPRVALRKESVDRNKTMQAIAQAFNVSLSARRAWIEIVTRYKPTPAPVMSLSARRAWIEICFLWC